MSDAVIDAFRALDVDIFETDTQLEDWINTDALDEFAWRVDRPLALMTRIWGYNVVFDGSEIRIHADS